MIGWAAGSVPLRLQQLNSVEERIGIRRSPGRKGIALRLQFGGSGGSVTESSLFAEEGLYRRTDGITAY
jgi:hypothetical protein